MADDLHMLKAQLEEFEKKWDDSRANEFKKWNEDVLKSLTAQNKVRFRKLSFYEEVGSGLPDFNDDIPF